MSDTIERFDNITIELEEQNEYETNLDNVEFVTVLDHSKLNNLDYEHSGHTGFASQEDLDDIDERVEKLENKPYISLERLGAYLYKITFDKIPQRTNLYNPVQGGCTSFVRDGKLYRNLDWNYSNVASFRVIFKNFEGMAFIDGLDDGNLDDDKISQLPYHIVDGRNDDGIRVSTHVLFNDFHYSGSGDLSIPINTIPFHVLNEVDSLDNLETILSPYLNNIKIPQQLIEMGYLIQFLVTDGTSTYAILPPLNASGTYSIVDITENPKLTNFRWVNRNQVVRTESDIQDRPTGIERWNLIGANTKLEDLRFTLCYESPNRLSEFIGIDGTTKASSDAELTEIYNLAHQKYLIRTRNGETWQTIHSVVYSANGMESLWVQEKWNKDYASTIDELENRVNELEQDILDTNDRIDNLKTSEIENDGDGTSPFATQDYVDINGGKIDVIKKNGVIQQIVDKTVDIQLNKNDVGLENVDNTSDLNKPVSTTQQTAINNALDEAQQTTFQESQIRAQQDATLDNKLDVSPVMSTEITYNGDTVNINKNKKNLKTGLTSQDIEQIQLANSTNAGLMSPTTVQAIQQMRQELDALESQTIRLLYTTKSNPTAAEIESFVRSQGYTDQTKWASIGVVVKDTNHIWRCYSTTSEGTTTYSWNDIGIDTVNQFTNLIAGIIKGSQTDGQIYAEDDGTGSVNGWSDLMNLIGRASDVPTAVNTLRTIIAAFEDFPLNSTIVGANESLSQDISDEITNRTNDVATLSTLISNLTNVVSTKASSGDLNDEIQDRKDADDLKQDIINENNKLPYDYISGTPTIPTVNNGKLTIKKNGTAIGEFTANQSSDKEINIEIDLSGYVEKETGKSLVSNSDITQITTNKNDISSIKNGTSINDFQGVETALDIKVDKETDKSLISSSDLTKLDGIEAGAQVNPSQYLKSASVNNTTLTITKQDDTTITFNGSDFTSTQVQITEDE